MGEITDSHAQTPRSCSSEALIYAYSTKLLLFAAAAVGLILSTVVSLSEKALSHNFDFVFMAATVSAVNRLHLGVPLTLIAVGILAILFHHPRKAQKESVKA